MSGIVLPSAMARGALTLRLWRTQDVPALTTCIAENLDWLRPWMPWIRDEPLPEQQRLELVGRWREQFAAGLDATYGIFLAGTPVGGTGLHQRIGPGGLEMGYWVAQSVARRRIALTTAALLTDAALDAEGVDRVEIHHAVENLRSAGIPSALGYRRVGSVLGEPLADGCSGELVVWQMLRAEFTAEVRGRLEATDVRW